MSTLADRYIPRTWSITPRRRGWRGTAEFLILPEDITNPFFAYGAPWPFPEHNLPTLRLVEPTIEDHDGVYLRVTCQYDTEPTPEDEWVSISTDFNTETQDTTYGYTWEDVGTPVEQDIPSIIPTGTIRVNLNYPGPATDKIRQATGKLNKKRILGFDRGLLRFDGGSTEESIDQYGQIINVRCTLHIAWRSLSWQYYWRKPLPRRDAGGNILYYQGEDSNAPFYSPAKAGSMVYQTGLQGQAGWSKPYRDVGEKRYYAYEEIDFHEVLNIPKMAGDE